MKQSSPTYQTAHRRHWARAAVLTIAAAVVVAIGWPAFVQMALLAAAAAEVAIGQCVRERGRDEPVLEAPLRAEERRVRDELGLD